MSITNPVLLLTILGMLFQLTIAGVLIWFIIKQSRKKHGEK